MDVSDQGGLLRVRDGGEQPVTPLELFFDVVFVFAVTQLSSRLLEHLTLIGTLETLFLLLAVWWAWIRMTWFTNWFDPDKLLVRLLLIAVMLASLLMSVAIPEAFGERALMFALAYVAIQVGRTAFAFIFLRKTLGTSHPLSINFQRVLIWVVASGIVWIIGGLLEGEARHAVWVLALVLDYGSLLVGFYSGSRPFPERSVDDRGRALRRALSAVYHHRSRRVDPGDRHDLHRDRSLRGNGHSLRGRLPGQRGVVVDLLRPQLRGSSRGL